MEKAAIKNNNKSVETVDQLNRQADETRKMKPAAALELSKQAIDAAKNSGYKAGLAKAYLNAGICRRLGSNFESALQYSNDALIIYKEINNKKGESRTLNCIANIYLNMGSYPKAIEYFDECIYVLESIRDIDFQATVLSNRGLAYGHSGNLTASLNNYLESLSIYKSTNKHVPHNLYNNIGIAYLEIENYFVALKYFKKALKLEQEEKNLLDESYSLANIGRTYIYMGDFSNAIIHLNEATLIMKRFGDIQAESQVYSNLGKAYSKLKCYPDALKYFNRAVKYYKEIGDRSSVSHTLCELGELYFELNDYISSKKCLTEGLNMAIEISDDTNETRAYIGLAKLYIKFNDIEPSDSYLNRAKLLAERRKSYKDLSKIYKIFSDGYKSFGKSDLANVYMDKYFEYIKKLKTIEEENNLKAIMMGHETNNNKNNEEHADSNLLNNLPKNGMSNKRHAESEHVVL